MLHKNTGISRELRAGIMACGLLFMLFKAYFFIGGGGGGSDIEKIEKECWSRSVDCLSLLQICYFYINNPLVMKAILFCDEPYFRYIHEEGGKLLQWAQRPSFPG